MSTQLIKPGDDIEWRGAPIATVTAIHWNGQAGIKETVIHCIEKPSFPVMPQPIAIRGIKGVIWGVPGYKKPYRGNLVGNIRIKYRTDNYAKIYVRDPVRLREYLLIDEGEYVTTGMEMGQNQRGDPRTK